MKKRFLLWLMIVGVAMICVACKGQVADKPVETESEDDSNVDVDELDTNMIKLTRDELNWFEYVFFNNDENWIRMLFLCSAYENPLDIDLGVLFYNGLFMEGESATRTEEELLVERYGIEIWGDVTRMPEDKVNEVLQQYTSFSLEETHKVGFNFYYLEEYHSYYNMATDAIGMPYVYVRKGWKNEAGTIALTYSTDENFNDVWQVILHEEDGHYYFSANIRMSEFAEYEDVPEDEIIYGQ